MAGVGLLREAVRLTSLMRVPALAFAIRPKGPGLYLLAQLPALLPGCHNSEHVAAAGRWIRAWGRQTVPHAAPTLAW